VVIQELLYGDLERVVRDDVSLALLAGDGLNSSLHLVVLLQRLPLVGEPGFRHHWVLHHLQRDLADEVVGDLSRLLQLLQPTR
jgi:hypothetical protein